LFTILVQQRIVPEKYVPTQKFPKKYITIKTGDSGQVISNRGYLIDRQTDEPTQKQYPERKISLKQLQQF
jgi:hypothetical protein